MIHSIPYRISSSGSLFSWITKKNMWRCDTHFHKVYTHAYKYINYISCLIISNDCKTFVVQKNNSNSILQIYLCCLRKPFLVIQQHFCAKRLWSGALSHPDGKRWSEPETLKVRLFLIWFLGCMLPSVGLIEINKSMWAAQDARQIILVFRSFHLFFPGIWHIIFSGF